jgi:replication-associated recombination protein RarA
MIIQPIVHPAGKHALDHIIADLPQSLLICGPEGVGLSTLGRFVAQSVGGQLITILPEKDEKVDIEKGTINVQIIRSLYDQTKSRRTDKLIIMIDYAERMGHQAQNAFLKLLEEPLHNVYFMLLSHSPQSLLPTVLSRVSRYDVRPINSAQTDALLDVLGILDNTRRSQITYMAAGLPAEINRLHDNSSYFEVRSSIMRDARTLLQGTAYEKLQIAHQYKDSRDLAINLLDDALHMIQHSISAKPQQQLISKIDGLLLARQKIVSNGSIRLCLARFVVQ